MSTKAKITQRIMKVATRTWQLKNRDQLDPAIKLLLEVFGELIWENQNSIENIREGLLQQLASTLTPDSLAMAKPANTIAKAMPVEPVIEIGRRTIFYSDTVSSTVLGLGLKTLNFAPVTDHIKLVKGEIQSLLCERNLYRLGMDGEKDLLTRANAFSQDLNRCLWIGFDLDKRVESLQDIHFYVDFPNLANKYDLYDLLAHTHWSINGKTVTMEPGIKQPYQPTDQKPGGIFSHYNTLNYHDKEIMDLYRKQFLYIKDNVRTAVLDKVSFPEELAPYFPDRVNSLDPQYWIKVEFPSFFKSEDIDDIILHLNAFPVSNKNLKSQTLDNNKSLTGIITLPVITGEYFFAIDHVEDSRGRQYNFIPYASQGKELGGTYTLRRGGLERFSVKELADMIDEIINAFQSEFAVFKALKVDNIRNSINEMEEKITSIKNKMELNNSSYLEVPTYLLIDSEEKDPYMYVDYWSTNCELANGLHYGTVLNPLEFTPLEKNSCIFLKATKGGRAIPKNEDMLSAYKLSLTTHGQLYSAMDYENYCRMKFSNKISSVKIRRGVACSKKTSDGLVRTIDICLTPSPEYRDVLHDPVTQGELKLELEKLSPYLYNFRVIIEDQHPGYH